MGSVENLLRYNVDDDLALEGVALLFSTSWAKRHLPGLPAVVTPLFFLGRSTGVSVASTKTTVQSVSLTSRR